MTRVLSWDSAITAPFLVAVTLPEARPPQFDLVAHVHLAGVDLDGQRAGIFHC
jgi:hypothetical protein